MDTDDDHTDFEPPVLTKFTGDYFSNYDGEDFEWPEDRHQFMESEDNDYDKPRDEDGDRDKDGDGDIVAAHDAELEHSWEFPAGPIPPDINSADSEDAVLQPQLHHMEQQQAEAPLGQCPTIEKFSQCGAGAPLYCASTMAFKSYKDKLLDSDNKWAPFTSRIDYKVAKWAKLRDASLTAFSDLLAIDRSLKLYDALGLFYRNSHELNQIID
ncbi:hypothetical protein BDR06DRAFT_975296 [Suillus hirtellus]|nr:hypothetical protein BDR06DRAFT_975296 [Suillus hirtellus]